MNFIKAIGASVTRQLALEFPPPVRTFENFFAARNERVVSVLVAASERCVYLWGAPGSGRSHLLQAAQDADATLHAVDDVERLDPAAQTALFDRYNDAARTERRILVVGDTPPAQLLLREDLRTRIGQSLVFEVVPLTDEERLAALHAHAHDRGMRITDDVLLHIARRVGRDMSTQMAVLNALDRYSLEQKRALTLPLARAVLAQHTF